MRWLVLLALVGCGRTPTAPAITDLCLVASDSARAPTGEVGYIITVYTTCP